MGPKGFSDLTINKGNFSVYVLFACLQEGRGARGRRHRVHDDRAEGARTRGEAPLPLSPLLHLPDRCKHLYNFK